MSIQAGWNAALGSWAVIGGIAKQAEMAQYEQEKDLYNRISDFHKSFDESFQREPDGSINHVEWQRAYNKARTDFERSLNVEGMPKGLRRSYNKAMTRYGKDLEEDIGREWANVPRITADEAREITERNSPATTSAIDETPDYQATAANIGNFSEIPGQAVASRIASLAPEAVARQQAMQAAQVADSAPVNNMNGVREGLTRSMSSRQVLDSVHRMERGGLD